jgi:DNA-binding transcriptional ArsR family regulator
MADASRSRILVKLIEQPGYPAELARELELTRSNVSNHLSCLLGCGLVRAIPEGRQTRYEIADPHLAHAITELMSVVLAVDSGAPCKNPHCDVEGCCE